MDPIENYPQGYWQAGNKKFINKYEALLHATTNNLTVQYNFFNSVWENFDRTLLGTRTLKDLYKERAQQLRDKYDYLIVYFSGGADSYNVIRSFIDNGIKLDEVCIKWCKDTQTANSTVYSPNTKDKTALNYLSEWDYAIEPVLKELAVSHPEINIEIVDWFKNKNLIGSEDTFHIVNHWHDVEVPSLAVWSPNEGKLVERGKRVASIYGVDKPSVYFEDDGRGYMFFADGAATMGTPNPCNIYGTEYFYWSPDFPLLAFEGANRMIEHFQKDEVLASVKYDKDIKVKPGTFLERFQIQQKRMRHLLYDNWTDRFQALKPATLDRSDKHFWIYKYDELEHFKNAYRDMIHSHISQLSRDLYWINETSKSCMYKMVYTKKFLVR